LNVALGSNIFGRSSHPTRARKRGGVGQVAHALEAAIAREFTKVRLLGGTGASQTLPSGVIDEGINRSIAHASFERPRQQNWLQPMHIMVPLRCLPRILVARLVVVPGCALMHFE